MGNNFGSEIGFAAEGIGSGLANYELAKNAPKQYYTLQIIGWVAVGIFILLFIGIILAVVFMAPKTPTSTGTSTNTNSSTTTTTNVDNKKIQTDTTTSLQPDEMTSVEKADLFGSPL